MPCWLGARLLTCAALRKRVLPPRFPGCANLNAHRAWRCVLGDVLAPVWARLRHEERGLEIGGSSGRVPFATCVDDVVIIAPALSQRVHIQQQTPASLAQLARRCDFRLLGSRSARFGSAPCSRRCAPPARLAAKGMCAGRGKGGGFLLARSRSPLLPRPSARARKCRGPRSGQWPFNALEDVSIVTGCSSTAVLCHGVGSAPCRWRASWRLLAEALSHRCGSSAGSGLQLSGRTAHPCLLESGVAHGSGCALGHLPLCVCGLALLMVATHFGLSHRHAGNPSVRNFIPAPLLPELARCGSALSAD
jgi:hypothetical protein